MQRTIFKIEHATILFKGTIIFEDLNFEVKSGEQWALVGNNGSGKSALLRTISGKFIPVQGKVSYDFHEEFIRRRAITHPYFTHHDLIAFVDVRHDFRNRSNTNSFYYQQRYNATDATDAPTVEEYLKNRIINENNSGIWTYEKVCEDLDLRSLLQKELIKLSNGESKRLRIAAALLKNPVLLLIDNTFAGLDVSTRKYFNELFREIVLSGITIIMVTTPNEVPQMITDVAMLEDCKIIKTVKFKDYKPKTDKAASLDLIGQQRLPNLLSSNGYTHFDSIVKMNKVSVKYGDDLILDQISWEVKQGERWALSGPNGSGKTTLLSLINGDNPQAYANDIILFDRKRGTGESIWDIKKNIGFMSPELYQCFPSNYTCLNTVLSGFYDTIGLYTKPDMEKKEIAAEWLELLGLHSHTNELLLNLPASKQRLCLLARALVKKPVLLILDEPCQGLDDHRQLYFKSIIDEVCNRSELTMIYVTHYEESLPGCIDRTMNLEL